MLGRIQLSSGLTILAGFLIFAPAHAAEKKSCGCMVEVSGYCVPKLCFDEYLADTGSGKKATTVIKNTFDPTVSSGDAPPSIFETGYSALTNLDGETKGYGLYSYAIVLSNSPRNIAFMKTIFQSVAPVGVFAADKLELNILYIPVAADKKKEFLDLQKSLGGQDPDKLADSYMRSFHDQAMALAIFKRICDSAQGKVRDVCTGDFMQGPFLFTYTKPVTGLAKVPPPYLFADLRLVHERAFPTILSKFKEQVKGKDYADDTRIDTFSTKLLSLLLSTADWTDRVKHEMTEIVHVVGLSSSKKN